MQVLQVRTTLIAAETLATFLDDLGCIGSAIERRRGARLVRLQAYFPPDAQVPIDWVRAKIVEMRELAVPVGPGEARILPLRGEDWAESWKRHFHAVRATDRLWIVPTWDEPPDGAAEVIRIDPGMAFGLGDHPTTRGCLEMMEEIARSGAVEGARVADVGTGTGILAIRASQLGYGPIDACDTDPESVRAARENAERNGIAGAIDFQVGTLPAKGAGPYQLILANLFLTVLQRLLPRFARHLERDGDLIVAGITDDQEDRFMEAARSRGFRAVDRICDRTQPRVRRWPVLRLRKRGREADLTEAGEAG